MLTLVIERSTNRPGWALFREAVCQLESISDEEPSRAPDWLPRLGAALHAAGVSLADVDTFAAGLGPGSFSGTRAAVAALQGMALPDRKPLKGVSSAAALAFALLTERVSSGIHTPVAVLGDARRERLWCAVYTLQGKQLQACVAGSLRTPTHDTDDFSLTTWMELPNILPAGALVVTPDWERLGARLSALLPAANLVAQARTPTAAEVGRLLLSDPAAVRAAPIPIYLHPAVAEVRA
ncbi:MAG: tRNA (adenosine(37)-N6)-threonylcarbamoyltransferase complex dimerization subunit type 1 TsaB [bacterium]